MSEWHEETREEYKKIGEVACPDFHDETVVFNAKVFSHYWEFEAVVDDNRIKVVVRQCGNGKKHFWSVIPGWRKMRFETRNARGSLRKI